MPQQMYWRRQPDSSLILYVKTDRTWQPYNAIPAHLQATEDTPIKGVRTMQKLLSMGYELVSADRAKGTALLPLSGLSEEQRRRWIA